MIRDAPMMSCREVDGESRRYAYTPHGFCRNLDSVRRFGLPRGTVGRVAATLPGCRATVGLVDLPLANLPPPLLFTMSGRRLDFDTIGLRGRTLLAGCPGGRYPVQRFALEAWGDWIYLTADGFVLARFPSSDRQRAAEAFHTVYLGRLIAELQQ